MQSEIDWSLKGKKWWRNNDALSLFSEKIGKELNFAEKNYNRVYLEEDINTLRQKLIEDINELVDKDWIDVVCLHFLNDVKRIINKRFGKD